MEHGQKLADTASLVANFGATTADKQLLDQINASGQEVGRKRWSEKARAHTYEFKLSKYEFKLSKYEFKLSKYEIKLSKYEFKLLVKTRAFQSCCDEPFVQLFFIK